MKNNIVVNLKLNNLNTHNIKTFEICNNLLQMNYDKMINLSKKDLNTIEDTMVEYLYYYTVNEDIEDKDFYFYTPNLLNKHAGYRRNCVKGNDHKWKFIFTYLEGYQHLEKSFLMYQIEGISDYPSLIYLYNVFSKYLGRVNKRIELNTYQMSYIYSVLKLYSRYLKTENYELKEIYKNNFYNENKNKLIKSWLNYTKEINGEEYFNSSVCSNARKYLFKLVSKQPLISRSYIFDSLIYIQNYPKILKKQKTLTAICGDTYSLQDNYELYKNFNINYYNLVIDYVIDKDRYTNIRTMKNIIISFILDYTRHFKYSGYINEETKFIYMDIYKYIIQKIYRMSLEQNVNPKVIYSIFKSLIADLKRNILYIGIGSSSESNDIKRNVLLETQIYLFEMYNHFKEKYKDNKKKIKNLTLIGSAIMTGDFLS